MIKKRNYIIEGLKNIWIAKQQKKAEKTITLALTESLNKRIAYLKGNKIIDLTEYAQKIGKPTPAILNAAKRQTIPAFREKGVWKIGVNA